MTFTEKLPWFGVLQMTDVTWESIGSPDEVLVTVAPPTSGAQLEAKRLRSALARVKNPNAVTDRTPSEDITWRSVLAKYHPWAVCSYKGEKLFREILERLEALEAKSNV